MIRFFVSFASVTGVAGAWEWTQRGEPTVALALVAGALVLACARLTVLDGRTVERPDVPVKAPLLAVLLVTTAVAPAGPVGTATAAEAGDCSKLDDFVYLLTGGVEVLSGGRIDATNENACSRAAYRNDAIEDMNEIDANQTKQDIYSAALGLKAGTEAWSAPFDNYLNDTESVAWMKVETAVAEAYDSGKSEGQAVTAAHEAIQSYYSIKQVNLIEQWNSSMNQMNVLEGQSQDEDGISNEFVRLKPLEKDGQTKWKNTRDWEQRTVVWELELANGSQHDHQNVLGSGYGCGLSINGSDTCSFNLADVSFVVNDPNQNKFDVIFNTSDFVSRWEKIESMKESLMSESENFVAQTWSDYDSGRINASDVISANTAMFEYGVRSANESEGLYRSTAALSMMGYDTPNMSNAGTMTVEYQGQTHTGLVLAENAPGGSWTAGTTYDPANISGPVFMATSEGGKIDLTETFTIVNMTAKDGSEISTQETTEYVYKTADTNELLKKQQQLLELRQEIENREPSPGGGGSGGFGLDNLGTPALVAIAAGAALLLGRQE